MFKNIIVALAEIAGILGAGILLLIAFTGGFEVEIGAIIVKAHRFDTPLIILMIAVILRKIFAGSFLHDSALRRVSQQISVKNIRYILLLLAVITGMIVAINPMRQGLTGEYFENIAGQGSPILTVRERIFDLDRMKADFPEIPTNYSISWRGAIFIPTSGEYQFDTVSDDGSELWIDDRLVVNNGGTHGIREQQGTISLPQGFHAIRIRYVQQDGGADFGAHWRQPGKRHERLSRAWLFVEKPANMASFWIFRIRRLIAPVVALCCCPVLLLFGVRFCVWFTQKLDVWRVSPLTRKLFLVFLLNGVVVNVFLATFGNPTTLYFTRFFLASPAHDRNDSWQSMHRALEYLRAPEEDLLYTQVFFQEGLKLQYPPTSLLIFKPFPELSLSEMASISNFLSWIGILVTTAIIAHLFSISLKKCSSATIHVGETYAEKIARWAVSLCFTLTFYPIVRSFQLGQIQCWIYCLFVLALWAWMANRKTLAGFLIGLICVIKPQLGLLAIWGMLRKEWRFANSIFATAGIMLLMSLWVFGLPTHLDYLPVLTFLSQHGESYYPNQSINGLLHRLFLIGSDAPVIPFVFPPYNPCVYFGTLITSGILILLALLWKREQYRGAELTDFSIAALTFTLASPIAWEHHYGILLPIFAVTLPIILASASPQRGITILAIAFVLSSNFYDIVNRLANSPMNFLQSYLFFGAFLFLIYLYRLRNARCVSGIRGENKS